MTAAQSSPAVTVRGPADLINAVPYLLGFHPVDSLVVIGMAHGNVVVSIRVDLDAAVTDQGAVTQSIAAMRRGGAEQFIGVVFDETSLPLIDSETLPWSGLIADVMMTVMSVDGDP